MKTAILCRTNAPLVSCAFDLIKMGRGVKVRIVGRDVAKKLKEVVGEVLRYRRNSPIEEFVELLNDWVTNINRRFGEKESYEEFVAECNDYFGCLKSISLNSEDANGVYKTIDEFFVDSDEISDKDDSIVLSTGHRAKGLEWDRCVVLRPDLMKCAEGRNEADEQQELNLQYVIYTRPKVELVICHDTEPE